jgi:hypothetical protein
MAGDFTFYSYYQLKYLFREDAEDLCERIAFLVLEKRLKNFNTEHPSISLTTLPQVFTCAIFHDDYQDMDSHVEARKIKQGSKPTPIAGRRIPCGYETLRIPHFLNNRLTDDRKVVSFRRRPRYTA